MTAQSAGTHRSALSVQQRDPYYDDCDGRKQAGDDQKPAPANGARYGQGNWEADCENEREVEGLAFAEPILIGFWPSIEIPAATAQPEPDHRITQHSPKEASKDSGEPHLLAPSRGPAITSIAAGDLRAS